MFNIYRSQEAMLPLQQVWEQANDDLRAAILRASHAVDQQLQTDPHKKGESRGGGTRIVFQEPLAFLYEVDEPKKLVRILRGWAYLCKAYRPNPWE